MTIISCPVCACNCHECVIGMDNLTFMETQNKSDIFNTILQSQALQPFLDNELDVTTADYKMSPALCPDDNYIYYGNEMTCLDK